MRRTLPVKRPGARLSQPKVQWTPSLIPGLLWWHEPGAVQNTLVGGAAQQFFDLSGNSRHANATSSGARPPVSGEDLLSGVLTARFGTSHHMKVTAVPYPTFLLLVGRPNLGATSGYLATSYGPTFVPCIRNDANYGWGYQIDATNNHPSLSPSSLPDHYFRTIILNDGGSGANACYMKVSDSKMLLPAGGASLVTTDAAARQGSGLDFTYNDVSFPTIFDMACCVAFSATPTAQQISDLLAWAKDRFLERKRESRVEWVGTLSTDNDGQPRHYPELHNGVSTETLAGMDIMMNGIWGNSTDFAIGSPGDPGVGNRGAWETICVTQGKDHVVAFWFGPPAVETQQPDITVYFPAYITMIKRAHAIASLGPGSIVKHVICPIMPGLQAPYSDVQGAIWNAWAKTTLQTTLASAGVPVEFLDLTVGFNTGTMLPPSNQHFNWPTGCQFIGNGFYTYLTSRGYDVSPYKLWFGGHSHVTGSSVPDATASFRGWLAYRLAA